MTPAGAATHAIRLSTDRCAMVHGRSALVVEPYAENGSFQRARKGHDRDCHELEYLAGPARMLTGFGRGGDQSRAYCRNRSRAVGQASWKLSR